MNSKERKKIQLEYVNKNIDFFFNLLENNFEISLNKLYLKEIIRLSTSFNIRLSRENKLKFCKRCLTYFNLENKQIRFNSKLGCIEHICLNCNNIKRIKYK